MTEDELQAIEALATLAATDEDSAYKGLVTRDVPALVAEVRRLRRFAKGALIALPHVVGAALLNDCGIEYAENTTGMMSPLAAKPTMK